MLRLRLQQTGGGVRGWREARRGILCVCVCTHAHKHVYICIHTYIIYDVYLYVYVYAYAYAYVLICFYIYTHKHTHTLFRGVGIVIGRRGNNFFTTVLPQYFFTCTSQGVGIVRGCRRYRRRGWYQRGKKISWNCISKHLVWQNTFCSVDGDGTIEEMKYFCT